MQSEEDNGRRNVALEALREEKGIDTHIPLAAYRYCRRYRYLTIHSRESVTNRSSFPRLTTPLLLLSSERTGRESSSSNYRSRLELFIIIYPFFDEERKDRIRNSLGSG